MIGINEMMKDGYLNLEMYFRVQILSLIVESFFFGSKRVEMFCEFKRVVGVLLNEQQQEFLFFRCDFFLCF